MTLRFGAFELDLSTSELRKGGTLIKLGPQPFVVLRLLAESAGNLRTREEIRQALWGEGTHVDFDRNLNVCMAQIRAALSDDADAPRFIQTVPRRGYRFVAPVEKLGQPRKFPWAVPAICLAVVALALALVAWRPAAGRPLIAALPFEDLSGDARSELFLDGLADELIGRFGELQPQRIGVIARTSVMRFKGSKKGVDEIGRDLAATYLVEGSIRWEGQRLHVTARLVLVRNQAQIASDAADFDASDRFSAQRQIATRLASTFGGSLFPGTAIARRPSTPAPAGADAYNDGRALQRKETRNGLERSLAFFRRAVAIDPAFAEAWTALSEVYVSLGRSGGVPEETFGPARQAAQTALKLDEGIAEAHNTLGNTLFWFDWNWPEAQRHFERAIALNPSLAVAQHDYAFFLVANGRTAEGVAALRQAMLLDPLSPRINIDAAWLLLQAHRYDDAIAQARRTLQLEPGLREAHSCLMRAAMAKGDYRLAAQELGQPLPAGDPEAALRSYYRDHVGEIRDPYIAAVLQAFLGNRAAALDLLERVVGERKASAILIGTEPAFVTLHGDPRYRALLSRISSR